MRSTLRISLIAFSVLIVSCSFTEDGKIDDLGRSAGASAALANRMCSSWLSRTSPGATVCVLERQDADRKLRAFYARCFARKSSGECGAIYRKHFDEFTERHARGEFDNSDGDNGCTGMRYDAC
jgi:hypothetical protein